MRPPTAASRRARRCSSSRSDRCGFTQRPCALESRTPAPPTVSSVETPAVAGEDVQGKWAGGLPVQGGAPDANDRPASIPEVIAPEPLTCS